MRTYSVLNILLRVKVGPLALERYLNELRIIPSYKRRPKLKAWMDQTEKRKKKNVSELRDIERRRDSAKNFIGILCIFIFYLLLDSRRVGSGWGPNNFPTRGFPREFPVCFHAESPRHLRYASFAKPFISSSLVMPCCLPASNRPASTSLLPPGENRLPF